MKLKDFEEEIYKCSRCGLCQSVCPVYKATLNECSVSRAKFNMLNGIIKGDLKLNKRIKSYMDLCTGCNACKNFCPSGIDAREIFTAVKSEYYKTNEISFFEKMFNSYFLFKSALIAAKIGFVVYRFLHLEKLALKLEKFILSFGVLGKRAMLLNSLARTHYSDSKPIALCSKTEKAIYFEGCFNKYINPQTENAVKKILENSGIEFIKRNFECCGVSYLNDGNIEEFNKLLKINLEKIDCDFDYILTDCASCRDVLKSYEKYDDSKSAKEISEKVIMATDLIKNLKFKAEKRIKVTFHKPCHDDYAFIEIIKNIENIEYIESEDFDKCCGFSGKFALKNMEISREISKQKALKFGATNSDYILTTCPACILGIEQGLLETQIEADSKPEVMNLFVFLAKFCSVA